MGITGLIPFLDKASRRANVREFSGCTVAIDSYCWLHKGAFACAERLVRGEDTDVHIKYCLKYVTMLLSYNIKPILVFDGRHLPAKALTEAKRRESRDTSKKRAAELLSLGKTEEARSYMRRSVDITHKMALDLIKECRRRNVDCIVAPYEADAELAYLNINNYAHLVITEDSDLILFGCTKVLFKMDLDGTGTLVETCKLPLVMKCPIERYSFDKFRQMCIMSGCDYLPSLPGIGLAKARQFVTATQDSNFVNALKKLPSFFNKLSLVVTDEYRESFLKADATFRHQYVYDPQQRCMLRLNDVDDEDIEKALCVNAGELLDETVAFQLALGNLDPFTLRKMDDWDPDYRTDSKLKTKSNSWTEKPAPHPSIWSSDFKKYLSEAQPWAKKPKKVEPIIAIPQTRTNKKVVNLVSKYVAETQDESLTIEALSSMYSVEPATKKQKICVTDSFTQNSEETQDQHNIALNDDEINKELTQREKSPILETKDRSFVKYLNESHIMKRLSRFPRTTIGDNLVESKFFSTATVASDLEVNRRNPFKVKGEPSSSNIEESSKRENNTAHVTGSLEDNSENHFKLKTELTSFHLEENSKNIELKTESTSIVVENHLRNPFKVKAKVPLEIDSQCDEIPDSQLENSQKENDDCNSPIKKAKNGIKNNIMDTLDKFRRNVEVSEENDYILDQEKSPILEPSKKNRNPFRIKAVELQRRLEDSLSETSVVENTYPMEELVTPVDSQTSFGESSTSSGIEDNKHILSLPTHPHPRTNVNNVNKSNCRVPGLKRTSSLPSNQPTLLGKFGFQKKPVLKRLS